MTPIDTHKQLALLLAIAVVNDAKDADIHVTVDPETIRIIDIEGADTNMLQTMLVLLDSARLELYTNRDALQKLGVNLTEYTETILHNVVSAFRWDIIRILKQKDTRTTNNDPSIKHKVRKRISEALARLSPAIADVTLTIDPVTLDITRIDGDKRNALGNLLSALDTAVTADKLRWNSNPPADGDDEHVLQEVITEYRLNIVTLIDECEESHDI